MQVPTSVAPRPRCVCDKLRHQPDSLELAGQRPEVHESRGRIHQGDAWTSCAGAPVELRRATASPCRDTGIGMSPELRRAPSSTPSTREASSLHHQRHPGHRASACPSRRTSSILMGRHHLRGKRAGARAALVHRRSGPSRRPCDESRRHRGRRRTSEPATSSRADGNALAHTATSSLAEDNALNARGHHRHPRTSTTPPCEVRRQRRARPWRRFVDAAPGAPTSMMLHGRADARHERPRRRPGHPSRWIAPTPRTIPIIAMTANAFAEDERQALRGGMNAPRRQAHRRPRP